MLHLHQVLCPFFLSKPPWPIVSGDILIDVPQRHAGVSTSLGSPADNEENLHSALLGSEGGRTSPSPSINVPLGHYALELVTHLICSKLWSMLEGNKMALSLVAFHSIVLSEPVTHDLILNLWQEAQGTAFLNCFLWGCGAAAVRDLGL